MRLWVCLLALLLAGCAPRPADWTLMFYVAADNDLEESELADLREVMSARTGSTIRLTALVDRSSLGPPEEGYSDADLPGQSSWQGARWLRLEGGQALLQEDWGEQNLADPAVLQRFLRAATGAFPARRQALILAGHGKGWRGLCLDAGAPDELLDPIELGTALAGFSLDLVVLDACLMSGLEVALPLAPRAHYLVASEELMPWAGLAYREPLERLGRQPRADGRQLGEWLVEEYLHRLSPAETATATLALLDLSRLAPVQRGVEALAQRLEHRPWPELARLRAACPQFGRSEDEPDAALFDLTWLARAAQDTDLTAALGELVVKACHGPAQPQAAGLSIAFPTQPDPAYSLPGWSALLRTYGRGGRGPAPQLGQIRRTGFRLRSRLGEPGNVRAAWLILAQDGWMLGCQPTVPQGAWLEDAFEGSWLQLNEGLLCPLAEVGADRATMPAQWRRGELFHDVTLTMTLDLEREDWEGRLASLTRRGQAIRVQTGDELRVPQVRLTDGTLRPGPLLRVSDPQHLRLRLAPLAAGRYEVGFLIESYAGRKAWRTLPVEVQ